MSHTEFLAQLEAIETECEIKTSILRAKSNNDHAAFMAASEEYNAKLVGELKALLAE